MPAAVGELRVDAIGGIRGALLALALAAASTAFADATTNSAVEDPSADLVEQAIAYEHGEGVPKDLRKASLLYCEAARAGNADAMYGLGWMYANGRGVARSDEMAAFLFARAAAAGNVQAQKMQRYVGTEVSVVPDCMRPTDPDPPQALVDNEPDPFADLPPAKKKIADLVAKAAPSYAIDPRLALAVIATESNFQPDALSPKDARGLMQLMAGTASRFKVKNRLKIEDNINGGLAYLQWLLAYYEGRVTLAVAAYNAGEAAVDRYGGVPPYPETQDYVRRVRLLFSNERHAFDARVTDPSPIMKQAALTAQ
jgi:hypothetical protein